MPRLVVNRSFLKIPFQSHVRVFSDSTLASDGVGGGVRAISRSMTSTLGCFSESMLDLGFGAGPRMGVGAAKEGGDATGTAIGTEREPSALRSAGARGKVVAGIDVSVES